MTFGTPQGSDSGSGSAETRCIRRVAFRVIVSFSRCNVLTAASSSWRTWRSWGDGPADGPAGSGRGWEALFPWRRASWEGTCTGIRSWSPFRHSVVAHSAVTHVGGKFGGTGDSLSSRTSSILSNRLLCCARLSARGWAAQGLHCLGGVGGQGAGRRAG